MLVLLASIFGGVHQTLFAQGRSNELTTLANDERVVVNTNLITVNVSVTDKTGHAVTGLDKSVFSIYDNNTLQEINFFSDDDVPASVVVVFDTSGSMSEKKIDQAKEALARFIKTSVKLSM